MELILASASPRRQSLLRTFGVRFSVLAANCDETLPQELPAEEAAEFLAVRKAHAVAQLRPDAAVIGADTTVLLDDLILGKPKDTEDCIKTLHLLSGREHKVITGVAIFFGGRSMSFSEETIVRFFHLSDSEIARYAATDEPYDKAGAYGIQGQGALFVEGIHGDFYNVMGLPAARLLRRLRALGILEEGRESE